MVRCREQRWRIADVRAHSACKVLSLAGAGAWNAGRTLQVVTPYDRVEPAVRPKRIRFVGTRRWRRRCRALLASQGPADRLQAAATAHIDLLPHQLEPVLAVVRGQAYRLLIADEVGLGKTIEAGLIVAELRLRQAADRTLILTPASLREQWAGELQRRFGLDPFVMDMWSAKRRGAELPVGVNPWATAGLLVTSVDFVKRPEVLPAVAACRWDLVVVDEAHGIGAGSDRREAVHALCSRASYVVLLSATPHNGSRAGFEALCGIGALSPDRFLVFRRTRAQVALATGRRVRVSLVGPTAAERQLHARLCEIEAVVASDEHGSRESWLALSVLQKRMLSSPFALAQTVRRRLATLGTPAGDEEYQLELPLTDAGGETNAEDAAPAWLGRLHSSETIEHRMLMRLGESADAAATAESKVLHLERLLRRLARVNESAIVFTEYRDTLLHLRSRLGVACAILHGGLSREERKAELASFAEAKRRVLLATDAAGEGLNLQAGCRVVINLELPWNPMRLEQRIGRVDRIGQRRRVHVFNLVAAGTGETRILDYLRAKLARIREDIDAGNPLGQAADDLDEAAVARRFAGRDDLTPSSVNEAPAAAPALARLIPEANRELERLTTARRFLDRSDVLDADEGDVWVARARHPRARALLGNRLLAAVRTSVEDRHGRIVASRLLPFLAASVDPAEASRHRKICRLVEAVEHVAADKGEWAAGETELFRAFDAAGRERHAAILASLEHTAPLVQAGLFDHRATRAAVERAQRLDELKELLSCRPDLSGPAQTGEPLVERTDQTALVLVPNGRW
jgi:superfamily II DNA or RNA helicase